MFLPLLLSKFLASRYRPISSLIHSRRFWSWPGLTKALRLRPLTSHKYLNLSSFHLSLLLFHHFIIFPLSLSLCEVSHYLLTIVLLLLNTPSSSY